MPRIGEPGQSQVQQATDAAIAQLMEATGGQVRSITYNLFVNLANPNLKDMSGRGNDRAINDAVRRAIARAQDG